MKLNLQRIRVPLARFTLEVDLELRGRVTAIFGPSGAGKTTLLELVAGLRKADSAFVQLDGRVLTDSAAGTFVPTRDRGIGYVPQDLALFPHLTVRGNILYGCRREAAERAVFGLEHVVAVLELGPMLDSAVQRLSGGEKQRVALARALLAAPRLLLLDEPLASLDLKLKARIIPYLALIRDEFKVPMLYVTHDRFETIALAEDMVVLREGQVAQAGPVSEVFSRPSNLDAACIVAVETIQPGAVTERGGGLVGVRAGRANLYAVDSGELPEPARDVFVCVRAEDVVLMKSAGPAGSPRNHLSARVVTLRREGWLMRVELDAGFPLTAFVTSQAGEEMQLRPGDELLAMIKAQNVHLIPR